MYEKWIMCMMCEKEHGVVRFQRVKGVINHN